jgi:predicted nucleic-acid-binding Zn-ribbon protein
MLGAARRGVVPSEPRAPGTVMVRMVVLHTHPMGPSSTCPKCGARDWLRIPGRRLRGFPYVQVGPFGVVPLVRCVCATCGFTEEWVEGQADLAKIRRKYGTRP